MAHLMIHFSIFLVHASWFCRWHPFLFNTIIKKNNISRNLCSYCSSRTYMSLILSWWQVSGQADVYVPGPSSCPSTCCDLWVVSGEKGDDPPGSPAVISPHKLWSVEILKKTLAVTNTRVIEITCTLSFMLCDRWSIILCTFIFALSKRIGDRLKLTLQVFHRVTICFLLTFLNTRAFSSLIQRFLIGSVEKMRRNQRPHMCVRPSRKMTSLIECLHHLEPKASNTWHTDMKSGVPSICLDISRYPALTGTILYTLKSQEQPRLQRIGFCLWFCTQFLTTGGEL